MIPGYYILPTIRIINNLFRHSDGVTPFPMRGRNTLNQEFNRKETPHPFKGGVVSVLPGAKKENGAGQSPVLYLTNGTIILKILPLPSRHQRNALLRQV